LNQEPDCHVGQSQLFTGSLVNVHESWTWTLFDKGMIQIPEHT